MDFRGKEFPMSDTDFRYLAGKAYALSGIVLGESKKELVYSRVARRVRALGLGNFNQYCDYLNAHEDQEVNEFLNSITTNLTSFFRESHHFEFLAKTVIPEWKKLPTSRPIRLWSSACSTGQEAYSMAITLRRNFDVSKHDIKILATDLDSRVLGVCKKGEYALSDVEQLPRDYHSCFYKSSERGQARIKEDFKNLIQFNRLNLLGEWPMKKKFDVIFCRNVVIYFNKESQVELFSRLADALNPGGYLFIGHSENLYGASHLFQSLGRTIYKKR